MSEEYPGTPPYPHSEQVPFAEEIRLYRFLPTSETTIIYSLPQSAEVHASWHEQVFARAVSTKFLNYR